MINLTIDNQKVIVDNGATILDAARVANIDIPTMCYLENCTSAASCLVCAVKVDGGENFLPACATVVYDGMTVDTNSEEVRECRKQAIELMLSEHAGTCEAPCTKICPCGLDVPKMLRHILSNDDNAALTIIRQAMPFCATLGYICEAACQKGCRRSVVDKHIEIQNIHKDIAEKFLHEPIHTLSIRPQNKNVAIIGGGAAGLTAAYFLTLHGYSCTIFERQAQAGGSLYSFVDAKKLPKNVLDAEIKQIVDMGVKFIFNRTVNFVDEIHNDYDAIIITADLSINNNDEKIFIVQKNKSIARTIGNAKQIAIAVDNFLQGREAYKIFCMNIGRLSQEETQSLATSIPHVIKTKSPNDINDTNDTNNSQNAALCFQCDCAKKYTCRLRELATEYNAHHSKYTNSPRKPYIRKRFENGLNGLVFESGKCIVCGKCVAITNQKNDGHGLSLCGRASNIMIAPSFGNNFVDCIGESIYDCVNNCPTGALSYAYRN